MQRREDQLAVLANLSTYNRQCAKDYLDGAPHINHASLRSLYAGLVIHVYDFAKQHSAEPKILDLGAGEGSATLPFLELGARVTAVDLSNTQLKKLRSKCVRFGDKLDLRCQDTTEALNHKKEKYDVIVASSFLHHVPDYFAMLRQIIQVLTAKGQFFSFQDPLRYDSLSRFTLLFSKFAYFSWRIFRGDLHGGLKRRIRRSRGLYLEGSQFDNTEYHITRNGVDQDGISNFFLKEGFQCEIISYFSTQSRLFQPIGSRLGIENTFAVIARRKA